MRAMAGPVGDMEVDGWVTPAGGGNEISRKSPPVWISAPAAAAAAARSAVGEGAVTGLDAGCAPVRGRRERVRPLAAAGAGCRAAAAEVGGGLSSTAGAGRSGTGAIAGMRGAGAGSSTSTRGGALGWGSEPRSLAAARASAERRG